MRYLRFPIVASTSTVHEPFFNPAWSHPLPDPTADPSLGVTAWPQHTQDQYQYPMSNEINPRPFPDVLDPVGTDTWEIPDDSFVRNINTQWPMSTMSQRNEIYGDNPITEHYPTSMPSIASRIRLPTTEFNGNTTYHTSHLPQDLSTPYYQPAAPSSLSSPGPYLSPESPSNSPPPAVSQRSSQECYDFWKKIPEDAIIITGSDKFVPQTLYRLLTRADRERYLELVHLSPPIIFLTKEPLEWGIPLEDVRNGNMQRLMNEDDPVLQDCGSSVCIRINWPGYSSFKRRIPSRNWRKTKGPITKYKLARELANITGQFIQEMSRKPLEVDADPNWRVGAQHIKLEDLILVSLHHVSKGSWQPQLRLRHNL